MMCYKDMTFCQQAGCRQFNNGCPRAFTAEQAQGALEWMGENAPVCFFSEAPDCFEPVIDNDTIC